MESWVQCNKCSRPLKSSRKDFILTSCQHIFCNGCVTRDIEKCPECSSVGVSTMPLMPLQPTLVPYFRSLTEQMEQFNQAATLQSTQAQIIHRQFCQMEAKFEILRKTYNEGLVKLKELHTCANTRREELRKEQLKLSAVSRVPAGSERHAKSNSFSSSSTEQPMVRMAGEWRQYKTETHCPSTRSKYPIMGKQLSNRQPYAHQNLSFARHEYSPQTIISPELSVYSLNTASTKGTGAAPRYHRNYTAHFQNTAK